MVLGMDDREGGRKDDSDLIDIEESEMTILYLIFNDEAKLFVGLHLKFNSFRNSQCNYIELLYTFRNKIRDGEMFTILYISIFIYY